MKKLLIILSLFISLNSFGQVFINSSGGIQPAGAYAGYYGTYLQGATKVVYDTIARNAIPTYYRDTITFMVYTKVDSSYWILNGGIANSNFKKVSQFNSALASGNTFSNGVIQDIPFYNGVHSLSYTANLSIDTPSGTTYYYIGKTTKNNYTPLSTDPSNPSVGISVYSKTNNGFTEPYYIDSLGNSSRLSTVGASPKNTGTGISPLTPVCLDSTSSIAIAKGSNPRYPPFAISLDSIPNNGYGRIVYNGGIVTGLNLSIYNAGQNVYLGDNGGISPTPSTLYPAMRIGIVTANNTNGSLLVAIGNVPKDSLNASNYFSQGGNSFGTTATLGTTDNNDLKIMNNNTNYWTFGKTGTLSNSGVSFDFAGDVTASSSAAITGGAIYPINYLSLPDTNRNVAYNLIGTHNGSLFAQIGSGQYFRQVLMAKDSSLYITPTYFNANKGTGSITGNSPTITSSKVPLTYWNGTNHVGYTNGVTVDTACGNVAANTFYSGFSNVAASGTQITLTVLSTPNYYITGSGGQVVQLPDATTLPNGCTFSFNNNQSSGAVTVNNNSGTTVLSIPSGGYAYVVLVSNGSSAGTWDYHFSAPSAVSWSTNTFNLGAASITNATWNGSVIGSTKGGAGSVTGILKADGSGNVSAATAGASNDYLAGSSLSATRNVSTGSIFTYNSSTGAYNLDTTKIVANITTGFGLTGIGTSGSPLKVDSASVATVTQTFSPIITLTDGATITWDARNGCNAQVTLAGTGRTLTISNAVAGRTYHLDVYQDATGSRTITTYTNFISPAGVIPSLTTTASSRDEICIFYDGTKFTSVWLLNCK